MNPPGAVAPVSAMLDRLRILHVEDDWNDVALVCALLEAGGLQCEVRRVETRGAFLTALAEHPPDLIVADYAVRDFEGLDALRLAREQTPRIPFIFLSGTAGEEVAIEALKAGATDYVLKERMEPLVASVRRALREAEEHRQRVRAEEALREAERRAAELARVARSLTASLDIDTVANRIVTSVLTLLKPQSALLRLVDPDGHLRCVAIAGSPLDDFQRAYRLPPNVGMVGRAVAARRAVWTSDLLAEPGLNFPEEFRRAVVRADNRAVLVVPLLVNEDVIGILSFAENRVRTFSEDEIRLLQTFADQAALAIRNVQLFEQERRARAEAEAANRTKDKFLAMLAHELRNPLAPIAAAAHVVLAKQSSDRQLAQAGSVIRRQVQQLARLLDDLLDVSRITRGVVELKKMTVDLGMMIAESVTVVQPELTARRHQLHVSVPAAALFVDADPARLVQVITNLLQNATKYTPPGGRIDVSADVSEGEAVIRVRDTGIGLDPEFLPTVFDLFTQADRSLARTEGGLGIGLTIVRSIVELHGGRVTARSEGLGTGTEFVVMLPLAATATVETRSPVERPAAARRHVLVIEDNEDSREMLRAALDLHGHRVDAARDGAEGVRLALERRPEVALVDIGLPGMDGYEVCRRIRETLGASIRLVALTGYGQPADRRRAREAGFDAHLTKPVDTEQLFQALT